MTLLKILLFNGIILKFDWFINTSAVLIWQVLVCTKVLKGHGDFQKGRGPSFEHTWIPYNQGCFVPSLEEIGPVVLEKKIFKISQCISLFRNYLPLEKGGAFHLNKLESTSPIDALCQVWLKLAQRFWRRKVYDNNDDDGQIFIRKDHLSHPSAHVS